MKVSYIVNTDMNTPRCEYRHPTIFSTSNRSSGIAQLTIDAVEPKDKGVQYMEAISAITKYTDIQQTHVIIRPYNRPAGPPLVTY